MTKRPVDLTNTLLQQGLKKFLKKKTPVEKTWGLFSLLVQRVLILTHNDHIRCLRTLRTLGNLELYLVAFVKRFESVPFNGGEVYENVIPVVSGNESIALLLIKPFHTTFGHYNSPPFYF